YVRSVESVWLVGILALTAVAALILRTPPASRWPRWQEVLHGEEGASYTLSYVLTIPIYVLLVALILESSLLLVAKVGTRYAAYAGARSAIVWQSAQPESLRQSRIEQATFTAMAPFCIANARQVRQSGFPSFASVLQAGQYVLAYKAYSSG